MTTSVNLVLFAIIIIGFIFIFRLYCKTTKPGWNHFFMYFILYVGLSLFCYWVRLHLLYWAGLCFEWTIPFFMWGACSGEFIPTNSGSGPSRSASGTEDSFEMQVLMEPFSETEMEEGASSRSSIPRVAGDAAGNQGSLVPNASLESSMRNRIRRLELDNSPYLLDKGKGLYWDHIKQELNNASSQREYSQLLTFENRDLQIRELKHECFSIFSRVLSQHPTFADQAPYNPQEVLDDFFQEHRDRLDQLHGLPVWERDSLELTWLDTVRKGLQDGGAAYIKEKIF